MPVQRLNQQVRDEIYRRTLDAVRTGLGAHDDPNQLIGHCLEFAWQGYQIIKSWPAAPRTIVQAGSAQWPRVPPELDDGVRPTHFAYEWGGESEIAILIRSGVIPVVRRSDGHIAPSLPEMHVWLGCPDTGEVIDFTTGLWPLACRATLGMDWQAPVPPDYLWTFGTRLPDLVRYAPSREAIECAIRILRQQGRQYP